MKRQTLATLVLGLLVVACGGSAKATESGNGTEGGTGTPAATESAADAPTGSDVWVEYTVEGDFQGTGREEDVVICSEGGDGELLIATRGEWYMDMEFQGATAGEHTGKITVTLPDGLEGAPANVFERRMIGEGTATISEAGKDALGLRRVEVHFSGTGLENDQGQKVSVNGKLFCGIF